MYAKKPVLPLTSRKLGKLAPRVDPRTLRFADYLLPGLLPPVPASLSWSNAVKSWPMVKNDTIGDCTIAAFGHMVQLWTAVSRGQAAVIPDDQIVAAYSAISGYDPKTGDNDNGCVELDVLNYARATGIGGHKIVAYVAIDPKRLDHVKRAVQIFGGVYIGASLPVTTQAQVEQGKPWSVVWPLKGDSRPGTWGGHAVPVFDFDPDTLTCITWAAKQAMTRNWWYWYVDECYALVSADWLNNRGVSPAGFNLPALENDLHAVAA